MRKSAVFAFAVLALLAASGTVAEAGGGWSIGFSFSQPCYRPCYGFYPAYHYYRPVPVFVEPRPVIVRPAPVVVQPVYDVPVYEAPAPRPAPAAIDADVERRIPHLSNPDERVRADVALELGRMKAERAVDPLAATLAGDGSPAVREAAARALGLIGSPRALTALTHAAQADGDRDVRNSARFAVEIIKAGR
jgi:hypothetical protein